MAVVRLGDRRVWRSGWRLLVGFLRQVLLTSLVAHYRNGLKRMKAFYVALMWDLIDGAATIEAVRSQMLVESYFAVPMVPVTVVSSHLPPSPAISSPSSPPPFSSRTIRWAGDTRRRRAGESARRWRSASKTIAPPRIRRRHRPSPPRPPLPLLLPDRPVGRRHAAAAGSGELQAAAVG